MVPAKALNKTHLIIAQRLQLTSIFTRSREAEFFQKPAIFRREEELPKMTNGSGELENKKLSCPQFTLSLRGRKEGVQANLGKCQERVCVCVCVCKSVHHHPLPSPPRPHLAHPALPPGFQGEQRGRRGRRRCGQRTPSRPPGLTILSRSSPPAWFMSLHVPLPGRSEERGAKAQWWGGGEKPGKTLRSPSRAPSHLLFRSREKWKPKKSQEKAQRGRVPSAGREVGGNHEGGGG
jgi:hypothetical protein